MERKHDRFWHRPLLLFVSGLAVLAAATVALVRAGLHGPPPSKVVAEENLAKEETVETVYVTRTGKKYHREGCQYLRGGGREITLDRARRAYEPCKVCDPP